MKKLQQLCIAALLTLVLTTVALAGDIHTGGAPEPPPPNQPSATMPGEIETPGLKNSQATSDSVADFGLDLLQIMLSAF